MDYYLFVIIAFCVLVWLFSTRDNENVTLKMVVYKLQIFFSSGMFMIFSTDNKGIGPKKNKDPDLIKAFLGQGTTKTIVFIRHGESDWNHVFNKGINFGLLKRFVATWIEEFKVFAQVNSFFIDSPLNKDGIDQALELRRYIDISHEKMRPTDPNFNIVEVLAGKHPSLSSVIVSSSLRRAVATTTVSLWSRISRNGEKVKILSSLQEISRNVDTYALSPSQKIADLPFSRIAPYCPAYSYTGEQTANGADFDPTEVFDCTENFGNKLYSFYGILRLRAFAEWCMKRQEDVIIVGGHSLWFKAFFQTFLPHGVDHISKKKKIVNSGVIAFTLTEATNEQGEKMYRIDPLSIQSVYGGFEVGKGGK